MNHLQHQQLEKDLIKLNTLHKHHRFLKSWSPQEKEEIKNLLTYHSTKIEGLQLSYGDTISFLKNRIIKTKARAKDISDLKNHRAILDVIFESHDSLALTESSIKKLHAELMQDPAQWDVIDALQAGPGAYKTENNYVFRPGGDHTYLDFTLVPKAMTDFIESITKHMQTKLEHPVVWIARMHFEFLQIHPFTDGNGRLARLLSTILLLKQNYPPLVIESEEKEKYFNALITSESQPDREAIIRYFVTKMIIDLSKRYAR
jgi:Fic family protein